MKNKKNGFTLIELIVVVTIIAVLTVMGVVSYSGTNKRARDSKRITDLESMRVALELYRQGLGSTYPLNISSLVPNYIQTIPIGPKGETYLYNKTGTGYTYTIGTSLEDLGSTNTVSYTGCVKCNYKVINP